MDINTLRSLLTVVSFVAFMGILYWAFSARAAAAFREAAELPFLEDEDLGGGRE
jgi:cytochrome c oxidase cbb3-type subunit 4